MVRIWLKNMSCLGSSEEELATIRYPRIELTTHVTVKNIQTLGMLGLAIVGPSMALWNGKRDFDSIKASALQAGRYGAMAGAFIGPTVVGARMLCFNDQQVYDRCYRLRHNHNVTRVDRMSLLGSLLGTGIAIQQGGRPADGALIGMAGGILLAAAYNIIRSGTVIPDTSGM